MKKRKLLTFFLFSFIYFQICGLSFAQDKIRFVPIGDSYTIGTGAKPGESWPEILAENLRKEGIDIHLVINPAVAGWTTQEALTYEIPIFMESKPNFATLMIGVNDWVRGVNESTFRRQLNLLLDEMQEALGEKGRLLVINIPDFSVTPKGPYFSGGRDITEGIRGFNLIIEQEASSRGLTVVDLFSVSRKMGKDPLLTSSDGLHPSAKGYALWERTIFPHAQKLLIGP